MLKLELPGYRVTLALLLSLVAVQATANLVNSWRDFVKGVDTKESAGDRTLVDNLVSIRTLQVLIVISLTWWLSFFIWSVIATNFSLVVLGLAALGTSLAIGYTAGPAPLKYLGLGDLAVFICFGPGVVAYSSTILVGHVPWEVIVFTVPATLYVIAILQANNYRDMEADQRTGARTVAILLGPRGSLAYYGLLLYGAHAGALAAGYWYNCLGATASLLVLPQSMWLCIRIQNQATLRTQDEETAKSAMMFGVALALGIITMPSTNFSMHGFGAAALVVVVLKLFAD